MPLLIMKTPTDLSTDNPNGVWDTIAHMLQIIDINRADFGTPELEWTSDPKSVFVVNASRKPLDRNIVEAFSDSCKFHVSPLLQHAIEVGDKHPYGFEKYCKTGVKKITPAAWAAYVKQWQEEKGKVVDTGSGVEGESEKGGTSEGMRMMFEKMGIYIPMISLGVTEDEEPDWRH